MPCPEPLSPASVVILTDVVRAAIHYCRDNPDHLFDVRSFAEAVKDRFDLKIHPNVSWCRYVLSRIPRVRQVDEYTWEYLPSRSWWRFP